MAVYNALISKLFLKSSVFFGTLAVKNSPLGFYDAACLNVDVVLYLVLKVSLG